MNDLIQKPFSFQVMAKPVGPICNLKCDYCYYLDKQRLYPEAKGSSFKMKDELLEEYTRQFISSQDAPEVTFSWQGGEPTLAGLDFFKKAIRLQKRYAGKKKIYNTFQTNGTLLDDDWCKFFTDNNILVGISIDGPAKIHDAYRTYTTNKPSSKKVMRGIDFLNKHGVEFNTLTVVNNLNSKHPSEVYNFLKSIGSTFHQYIPIVKVDDYQGCTWILGQNEHLKSPQYSVHESSVSALDYGKFMTTIFDEWIKQDVGTIFVQLFDITLANWMGVNPGLCVFSKTCGNALSMEHNGDVYSCDHFTFPEFKLGNVYDQSFPELLRSSKQLFFSMSKSLHLPNVCKHCEFQFACHGGCPKDRILDAGNERYKLNYLCEGLMHFFEHVRQYMNFMANELENERPPSNVMRFNHENK